MYFSKFTLKPAVDTRKLAVFFGQGAYGQHQWLWKYFSRSSDQERDFLYHFQFNLQNPRQSLCYALSAEAPTPLEQEDIWQFQTTEYSPRLQAGDWLAFHLRANPVVKSQGKGHDVVMQAKQRLKEQSQPMPPLNQLAWEAGRDWLSRRAADHGFALDEESLRVFGYEQHRLYPKHGGSGKPIRFSSLEFQGRMQVQDPAHLVKTLQQGLGKSKSFGCGLLLISRG